MESFVNTVLCVFGLLGFALSAYMFRMFGFKVLSFRVLEQTYMRMGKVITTYTVQQLHKLGKLEWWTISDTPGEWYDGSVFDSMEDAQKYIESCLYKPTRKLHPKQP